MRIRIAYKRAWRVSFCTDYWELYILNSMSDDYLFEINFQKLHSPFLAG